MGIYDSLFPRLPDFFFHFNIHNSACNFENKPRRNEAVKGGEANILNRNHPPPPEIKVTKVPMQSPVYAIQPYMYMQVK